MSTGALEGSVDESGSSRAPALRAEYDGLLDLADEFEARAPLANLPPHPRSPLSMLPVPIAQPAQSHLRRGLIRLALVAVGLIVAAAVIAVSSDWLETAFEGAELSPEDGSIEVGAPASEPADPVDGSSAEADPGAEDGASPGVSRAEPAVGAEPANGESLVDQPTPSRPADPEACGAADLLGAAQALIPDAPLTLSEKRCDGPYAVIGLASAPTVPPEQQLPPGWAAFRFDGESWQRLDGWFAAERSWVDACRAITTIEPAFPAALCG